MVDLNRIKVEVSNFTRRYDIASVLKEGGVGVELGVAEGFFSRKILEFSRLKYLYSVDMYAGDRGHGTDQYKHALRQLDPFRDRNAILRMRFDEAVDLFPDEYFDFIYVDGYAHTGEEAGDTFFDWYAKLKVGGIIAGDDYDAVMWPGVVSSVNQFAALANIEVMVVQVSEEARTENIWSRHATWLAVKTNGASVRRPVGGLVVPSPPAAWRLQNSGLYRVARGSLSKMKRIAQNVLSTGGSN